jgi:hypothetical protein
MEIGNKMLPKIDSSAAYVGNFVSITKRESFWQRLKGTRGRRVKEQVDREVQIETARIKNEQKGVVGN